MNSNKKYVRTIRTMNEEGDIIDEYEGGIPGLIPPTRWDEEEELENIESFREIKKKINLD